MGIIRFGEAGTMAQCPQTEAPSTIPPSVHSSESTRTPILRWALRAIGPALLLLILLYGIDLPQTLRLLAGVRWRFLLAAVLAAMPANLLLRALRWHLIAGYYDVPLSFRRSLELYLVSFSAGFLLSDSIGAFVRTIFLHRDGESLSISLLLPFWEKTAELLSILLMGVLGILLLPQMIMGGGSLYLLFIAAGGLIMLLSLILIPPAQERLFAALKWAFRRYAKGKAEADISSFEDDFRRMKPLFFLEVLLFSFGLRLLHYLYVYFLSLSLGIPLSYGDIVLVMMLVSLVIILPISIAGLGTREAVMIPAFALLGRPPEEAVALSLLIAATTTLWRGLGSLSWVPMARPTSPTLPPAH